MTLVAASSIKTADNRPAGRWYGAEEDGCPSRDLRGYTLSEAVCVLQDTTEGRFTDAEVERGRIEVLDLDPVEADEVLYSWRR